MKFQALFFVLFALASSFLSMVAVVSGQDSLSNTTTTTTVSSNGTFSTTLPPSISESNNSTNTNPGQDNSTSPTTVAVTIPTTTVLTTTTSSVYVSSGSGTVNGTESDNSTDAPPQNLVANNTTTTTTTQAPNGVSQACLDSWVERLEKHGRDYFCLEKGYENVTECQDKERQILSKYDCWLLEVTNSTGQNVSGQCIAQVNKCLFEGAGSTPEDMKNTFCLMDKEKSDCFTQSSNSSSGCQDSEYQIIRKVSDCSSSRRVAEACTLIVLLASVVALALTSE